MEHEIDWNRVASDLDVSNGHAARMRYSRFRQQMEGTTGAVRAKRKSKKDKNIEPPVHMQGIFPMGPPFMMPMDPVDPSLQSNPFVKCEPGTQGDLNLPSFMQYSPQQMSETTTQGAYYFPQDFASTQFQMASCIPSGLPSPSLATGSFMNPYQPPGISTGYPYSSSNPQAGFDFREFEMSLTDMNCGPSITWEPRPCSQQESGIIKVEEEYQDQEGVRRIEGPENQTQPDQNKLDQGHQREQDVAIKVEVLQD